MSILLLGTWTLRVFSSASVLVGGPYTEQCPASSYLQLLMNHEGCASPQNLLLSMQEAIQDKSIHYMENWTPTPQIPHVPVASLNMTKDMGDFLNMVL